MDFKQLKEAAEIWTKNASFRLILSEESERRLVFASGDVGFYIVCPEPGNPRWHVWSDNDTVLQHMAEVQDYVDSCREKSLKELLNRVEKSLHKLVSGEDEEEEDDDVDDAYYGEEDLDAIQDEEVRIHSSDEEAPAAEDFFTGEGSKVAVNRLLEDLRAMKKANGQYGVTGSPRGDNLFLWDVQLTDFDEDSPLGRDLQEYAKKFKKEPVVCMEMKFPKEYPMAPPFVRVLRPRFKFLTGHVTIGGSVCMEMLARSGWIPTNDIEGILVQIRAEIMSDPSTRLDRANWGKDYDELEARQAFDRMVQRYGWK